MLSTVTQPPVRAPLTSSFAEQPPVRPPLTSTAGLRWEELIGRDYCPQLVAEVKRRAASSTHESVTDYLRRSRPRGQEFSFLASQFWDDWYNRSCLVYGLLSRPGTVEEYAEQGLGLPKAKIYAFLRYWGIPFLCLSPAPSVEAVGDGRVLRGRLSWDGSAYWLKVGKRRFQVRYSWLQWVMVVDPGPDVPLRLALECARRDRRVCPLGGRPTSSLSLPELARDLHLYGLALYGQGVVSTKEAGLLPRRVLEDVFGAEALAAAAAASNRCGCVYWDDQRGGCGIDNDPEAEVCMDFLALEEA